ncbi:MAG: DUF3108 domain-containing protein [Acidobacteriota bacterium]
MTGFIQRGTLLVLVALCAMSFDYRLFAQKGPGTLTPPARPTADNSATPTSSSTLPFTIGESLSFNVSWASFGTAARLEMQVVDQGGYFGHEGFQLQTRVQTVGQARSIFLELDNQYTSYVHGATMLPHRLENSTRQGAIRSVETVILDQEGRTARFSDESSVPLPADTFDLASLVYALRVRPLEPGAKTRFVALFGRELLEIEAEAKEKARVQTQLGSYDSTVIELTAKGKSKYRIRLWMSTDKQRLPLLISGRLPFGEVRAELSSFKVNPRPKQILAREKFAEGPKGSGELFAELERSRPFSVGERLNYQVSWASFVSVGNASFSVRQRGWIGEQRVMELVGEASTNGLARSLIDVDDQMISLVDVKTLYPVRTETRLSEGARKKQVTANYADGSVRLTNGTHFRVTPGSLDLISLFYAVRASDLRPGVAYSYTLLDANHRPVVLTVRGVKQERVTVPFGTVGAVQLDVLDRDGKQVIAQVWISDDQRRIPLYLAIRTRFGELKFELTSAVGTR